MSENRELIQSGASKGSANLLKLASIVFVIFTLVGVLAATSMSLFVHFIQQTPHTMHLPDNIPHFFIVMMMEWYLWALFTPLIYYFCLKNPIESPHVYRSIFHCFLFSIAIGILKVLIDWAIVHIGLSLIWGPMPVPPDRENVSFWMGMLLELFSPKTFGYFLICWTIMAVIYAWRHNQQLKRREIAAARLQEQLTQAQLRALQMQLQPHFLFNTLNSISSLLYDNVEAADEMLTDLSELLRKTLANIGTQTTTLREEIDFVQHYLDIEKVRFQDRLHIEIDADPNILNASVPNLLLQPLAENSIRHGISHLTAKGIVSIRACKNGERVEITVTNDGPEANDSESPPIEYGNGLGITRNRLEHLYGETAQFSFYRGVRGGAVVTVSFPYREHNADGVKNHE